MELISLLSIANYFVQFIVITIIIGILVLEYFRRKPDKKKGILLFIACYALLILVNIFDTFLTFIGNSKLLVPTTGSIVAVQLILFCINSIRNWKFIDKVLFFIIISTTIAIAILRAGLSVTIESSYEFFVIIFFAIATISNYFFIIKFLINTSKR